MQKPRSTVESKDAGWAGLAFCLLAGTAIVATTVVALRYPFRFAGEVSADPMIRGMISALVLSPLTALMLLLSFRCSTGVFFASLLVPSFFSALLIHEVLFGNKMPERAYQEPLTPRIVAVGVYLIPLVVLPALLAILPSIGSLRRPESIETNQAEQAVDARP